MSTRGGSGPGARGASRRNGGGGLLQALVRGREDVLGPQVLFLDAPGARLPADLTQAPGLADWRVRPSWWPHDGGLASWRVSVLAGVTDRTSAAVCRRCDW